MEQAVVAKLNQLAEELFTLQQIARSTLHRRYRNKKHWQQIAEQLDNDIRESRTRIVDLLNCKSVRRHIQSLGSHACGQFAGIHDQINDYPLHALRFLNDAKHFNKWHLVEDEQAWASGWKELSQLSEWLLLIAGGINEGNDSADSNQSDIDEVADTLTRQPYQLFMRLAKNAPKGDKPWRPVSFDSIKAERIVKSDDDEAVRKAIKRLNKQLQVKNTFEANIEGDRVRLARISPDK